MNSSNGAIGLCILLGWLIALAALAAAAYAFSTDGIMAAVQIGVSGFAGGLIMVMVGTIASLLEALLIETKKTSTAQK